MSERARALAESASFQAFINCYLREVEAGQWQSETILQLAIPNPKTEFALEASYRSKVGRHQFVAVYRRQDGEWRRESFWSVLMLLVRDLYNRQRPGEAPLSKRKQLELIWRLTDSLQNMTRYLEYWNRQDKDCDTNFIQREQALPFGHWMHPTPKSRQGCLDWQQEQFVPELQGCFQLHIFAVDQKLYRSAAAEHEDVEAIIREIFALEEVKETAFIPVHPLQAQWLNARDEVGKLRSQGLLADLGPRGPFFSATSSMRTLYAESLPWMLKVSIPVKLTNSLRQNKFHELRAGVLAAQLIDKLELDQAFPQFHIIQDPAWVTARLPGGTEDSGFECILRRNPFNQKQGRNAASVAFLSQDNFRSETQTSALAGIIENNARKHGLQLSEASLIWFKHFWACVIEPCIFLWDRYGIALEAHQQNIVLDLRSDNPELAFFRDNQGFYLCKDRQAQLLQELPALQTADDLFFEADMIIERFAYYLFINNLFSIIHRFGRDQLIAEETLLRFVTNRLRSLQAVLAEPGRKLLACLLHSEHLASKANLLTRVNDIDELEAELELAIYNEVPNPITAISSSNPIQEKEYA